MCDYYIKRIKKLMISGNPHDVHEMTLKYVQHKEEDKERHDKLEEIKHKRDI